jgi:hypothetical protein
MHKNFYAYLSGKNELCKIAHVANAMVISLFWQDVRMKMGYLVKKVVFGFFIGNLRDFKF